MKIIVVDDEIASLTVFLSHVINQDDIEYKFFLDHPKKAIDYVKSNEVDGAFLDINMPEIDGVSLAHELLAVNPTISLVFITGYSYDVPALQKEFGSSLLGFAYKPYDSEVLSRYIDHIYFHAKKPALRFRTFGAFDLFVNEKPVHFSSSKSKELLALLVAYDGSSLTMDEAIANLWPEKDIDLAKRLYRDAVWRLRSVLKSYGLSFLVEFKRAVLYLKREGVSCDYWSFLQAKQGDYVGEFLIGYDWSLDYQIRLDALAGL
jgi:two-component system LytT family response regulator